jgi:hypothetical protein
MYTCPAHHNDNSYFLKQSGTLPLPYFPPLHVLLTRNYFNLTTLTSIYISCTMHIHVAFHISENTHHILNRTLTQLDPECHDFSSSYTACSRPSRHCPVKLQLNTRLSSNRTTTAGHIIIVHRLNTKQSLTHNIQVLNVYPSTI